MDDISLLSHLLDESKLYRQGRDFKELLDFVRRMPNFAPFNAFLLNVQKPGLRFAASQRDWQVKFNRNIKEGARPLVILWPFAPVVFVYDVDDTEGDELPRDIADAFRARGNMSKWSIKQFITLLLKKGIDTRLIEYGDAHAGHIKRPEHDISVNYQSIDRNEKPEYLIRLNKNHDANVQFATLTHELAHLFLGHLGRDKFLKIPDRARLTHEEKEIEAESVSYIVCHRNNVMPNSEQYLSGFVGEQLQIERLDIYAILKAAGQVETVLDLIAHSRF